MHYSGDLSDGIDISFTQPGFGIFGTWHFSDRLNLRVSATQGWISAYDSYSDVVANRYRNLSFISPVTEGAATLLLKPFRKRGNEFTRLRITPYVFGGVGFFRFNPQADHNGTTYDLHPMGTEGQYLQGDYPTPYSLYQLAIPAGAGLLFRLNYRWDLGLEFGMRKTFTDYLDDVSGAYPDMSELAAYNPVSPLLSDRFYQGAERPRLRGNPNKNDWYYYTNLQLVYYFYTARKGPSGNNRCIKVKI
jgi:hypothetical protein